MHYRFLPRTSALREFVDNSAEVSVAAASTCGSHAIHISTGINNQISDGRVAIIAACKVVYRRFGPRATRTGTQLENSAVESAVHGAVEISARIEGESRIRERCSASIDEVVEDRQLPGAVGLRGQFVERTPAVSVRGKKGRPVKISLAVKNYSSDWTIRAIAIIEGVENSFFPTAARLRTQFEHFAVESGRVIVSGAVAIA